MLAVKVYFLTFFKIFSLTHALTVFNSTHNQKLPKKYNNKNKNKNKTHNDNTYQNNTFWNNTLVNNTFTSYNTTHINYTLGLHRGIWNGLSSKTIKAMTSLKSYPKAPHVSYIVDQFSTPRDKGIKYGQRLYGYFVPPESGNYIFAASCTDECKLSLSNTDEESKKDVIISHDAGR